MTEQQVFMTRVIQALEKAGIAYLITGSIGSSVHGEPRGSRDIDFIIAPSEIQLRAFIADMGIDYYAPLEAALEAFHNRSMFNVIEGATGWKADLIMLKNTPYEKEKFNRRIQGLYEGLPITVATPEDMILSKLVWAKACGGSEKQLLDVRGIVATQKERLDGSYLRHWAKMLLVEETLAKILAEVEKVKGL